MKEVAKPIPETMALSDIVGLVGEKVMAVEKEFSRNLHSEVGIIDELGTYISDGGGKRVRPLLLLLSAQLAGYRGNRDVLFATVFEFIHTATLVHDDVIDGATTRRGRPSLNAAWGNNLTVLLGDYLYIKSMSMALTADDLRVIKVLAEITLKMIEGELIQSKRVGDIDISAEEHLEIIRRKTACLFGGCSLVGGILGAPGEAGEVALHNYGLNLGMSYQIVDDLLDLTADEKTLGKPVASDLREGKVTLPLIYLLEKGNPEVREKIGAVLSDGEFSRVSQSEIAGLIQENGTLERTRELAGEYAERACEELQIFPDGPARRALETFPRLVLSRDR